MVNEQSFKNVLEKEAGIAGVAKFMAKHPWPTIIAPIALAASAKLALSMGKSVHPLHQIVREETKNKGMKEQRGILKAILEEQKKTNKPSDPGPRLIKRPLV